MRTWNPNIRRLGATVAALLIGAAGPAPGVAGAAEGDLLVRDYRFQSGESLSELRLHWLTLGRPVHDARGGISNGVLILHGTGGTGRQFLSPPFANELYGPGAPLDTTRWYVILPDGIGHGRSSKPSDGLHARFPAYDYADMIEAQHRVVTEALGVQHLRLVMGTSMGGMQTWMWAERWPGMMDAAMPLACLPVPIAGRNRMWRRMIMDAIREDPDWNGGEYATPPRRALRTAADILMLAGSAPALLQKNYPTREAADAYVREQTPARIAALDANDLLFQLDASRNYDPSANLERITVPITWVNSADDFINPPELGIARHAIARVRAGRFVLIPASEATHGHGTHTWAALWKGELVALMKRSRR